MGEISRYLKENQLTHEIFDKMLRTQADQLIRF